MIYYDLGDSVDAWSTNIGDEGRALDAVTPAHQAHSTNVAIIPDDLESTYGVDALITDKTMVRIGVRTADCVPILLYDSRRRAVAAIHSGWKGTVNDIIGCAIAKMHDSYGCEPRDMRSIIGPCIHVEAFEVGDEVYEAFRYKGYSDYAHRMVNPYNQSVEVKWHIDLPEICRAQLSHQKVRDIYTSPYCTYRHHDMLHSYRYSKSADRLHRIVTTIMMKP